MTVAGGLFLIAHAFVHLAVWATPYDPKKSPFDPKHSWLLQQLGTQSGRSALRNAAVICAVAFMVAGAAVIADADWDDALATGAAIASTVLSLLTFNRWLLINLAINAGIIAIALG